MSRHSLLDRMHAAILESRRAWPAEEIGASFLKLQGGGGAASALVRSVLLPDGRFVESSPGRWSARAVALPPLARMQWMLAWIEAADSGAPERWRLHLRPLDAGSRGSGRRVEPIVPLSPDSAHSLAELRGEWRLAAWQSGPLGRFLQWMERRWAMPEWDPPPLDLFAWARVALAREGVPVAETLARARLAALAIHWKLGPIAEEPAGVPLPAVAVVLARLLERFGSWNEEDLTRAWREGFSTRPIDWDRFAFTREDVEAVPDASGIYRFFDAEDQLLYVGKAVRLSRRVGSYFRPLPPEPSKREQLLARIRRFEVKPLPSELEALVLEAEAIRRHRPPWNVQVEVHPVETLPSDLVWPLVFVAPGEDLLRASAFLIPEPDRAFLFHLPRGDRPEDIADLAQWLDQRLEGEEPETPPGVMALEPPEARVALRTWIQDRERLHRVDSIHFTCGLALAEALLDLAVEGSSSVVDRRPRARL